MLKKQLVILLIVVSQTLIMSNDFQSGNIEFSKKNYSKATEYYLSEIDNNGADVNTLYNLANSYIKQDLYGSALYTLYKAQLITKMDKDINSLTLKVQDKLNLSQQELTKNPLSINLNIIVMGLLIIILSAYLLLIYFLKLKQNKNLAVFKVQKGIYISLALLILISVVGNYANHKVKNSGVITETCNAVISPYEGSDVTFSAQEGLLLKITDRFNDFCYVTDNNNRYGWIPASKVGELWKE